MGRKMNAISDASAKLSRTRRATGLVEMHRGDQRVNERYPIALELQYKLLNKGREHLGVGRTLNVSSGGVLFEADALLPATGPIELAMSWPFLLEEICKLKLVMRGRIVRCETNSKVIAVKAAYHEFHTAGIRPFSRDFRRPTI
jgi:hypothetical protein